MDVWLGGKQKRPNSALKISEQQLHGKEFIMILCGVTKCMEVYSLEVKVRTLLNIIQFSRSVVSDSLWPHEPQHARPPCPSPTPRVYSNSFHWVDDAIQPSHSLSSPSPPTFNLSQHQGLFQWVSSLHQVAKVLEFQLQHQSFQWIFRTWCKEPTHWKRPYAGKDWKQKEKGSREWDG